ncbi:penicillin-binding protein 2 [Paenibacillus sp. SC116]|uniref:peptidoglycan D,D-transpeptidase FtsI family protein n=1 Tax=Paenibacillus sp. SC116 TaxID=2968986 RepID=UPI00215AF306|nr:penicillin-binding protein 2 [Paenibacillus sp. SC116]MCR8845553.1 penicillin-binding protein 2 [Paenibacillus sp. SC116]
MNLSSSPDPQERVKALRIKNNVRLSIFFFIMFLIFSILIVRLAVLQFIEGPELSKAAVQIGTKSLDLVSIRGTIYDAAGKEIAYSMPTQSLYFRMEKTYKSEKDKEVMELAEKIKTAFDKSGIQQSKPMQVKEIIYAMDVEGKRTLGIYPRQLKTNLSKQETAYFMEHRNEFPMLEVVEENIRQYDTTPVAPQLVGHMKKYKGISNNLKRYPYYEKLAVEEGTKNSYLASEEVGVAGLEYMYEWALKGKNGAREYPVDAQNRIIGAGKMTKPARGHNIHMTIHPEIQKHTQKVMIDHLKKIRNSSNRYEYAPNAITAYAVAMEVETGNIVAMANHPQYDPNIYQDGLSEEEFKQLGSNNLNGTVREVAQDYGDKKENWRHPSSLLYLGSTMKPLTILIGLKEGLIYPNTTYPDTGVTYIGRQGRQTPIHNASRKANGVVDTREALTKSSNTFMIEKVGDPLYKRYGKEKGLKIWDDYMKAFGLGQTTGSGFPGESPGISDYMQEGQSGQSSLAFASFGQQGKYTALQLAQYTATLANRGKRVKPQFVSHITDANDKVVKRYGREVLSTIEFDEAHWDVIEDAMLAVSAQGFQDAPYTVARKTGTSEQDVYGGKRVENAVFIAYAPIDKPKLAVAVVVPEGGYGSYGAAPIARQIFDAYHNVYGLNK